MESSTRDGDAPSQLWTRAWLHRLDEAASPGCPSSQASTPLQPRRGRDRRPSGSASESSDSQSDAEIGYQEDWEDAGNVQWPSEVSEDVTRSLPTELLLQIMQMLPARDLVRAMLVSKAWCLAAFPLLWQKPPVSSIKQFAKLACVLSSQNILLPYPTMVRRLVFNGFAKHLTDELFIAVGACRNLERLTLPGATRLTSKSLNYVFGKLRGLIAVDLAGVQAVNNYVVYQIASGCPQLQGLNLARCHRITDEGVLAVAERSRMLRRIKLSECRYLTDRAVVALTRACPLLLELDLASVPQLSDDSMIAIFLNAGSLRELRMNDNTIITYSCIPDLARVMQLDKRSLLEAVGAYPWYLTDAESPKAMARKSSTAPLEMDVALLRPVTTSFYQLRVVDFTRCQQMGDQAIDNLVSNAPQLRSITLTKCVRLTDDAIHSITRLGKHLHYLHLGHVSLITDDAVVHLVRSCTRLRYVDLTSCSQLTDQSVIAIATSLPKLRRVGLVKILDVTDFAIQRLAERGTTLERLHLSYCDNLSAKSISRLLNRLPLLMHLSLTGVSAFMTLGLQQFCRPPPETFNPHQRASFCVYTGHGVTALRDYLNSAAFDAGSSPRMLVDSLPASLSSSTVSGHLSNGSSSVAGPAAGPAVGQAQSLEGSWASEAMPDSDHPRGGSSSHLLGNGNHQPLSPPFTSNPRSASSRGRQARPERQRSQ